MNGRKFSNNADVLVRIVIYVLVVSIVACGLLAVIRHLVQEAQEEYRANIFRTVATYLDRI